MKNKYKIKGDSAILYCPSVDRKKVHKVTLDREMINQIKGIEGYWEEYDISYLNEQFPTTFGTIHNDRFIDLKRVVVGLDKVE